MVSLERGVPGLSGQDPSTGKRTFQLKGFEADWGYAQAVQVGRLIQVSGTVSINAAGQAVDVGDMRAQVRNVYHDIAASLAPFGATLGHVIRDAIYTTDLLRFIAEGMTVRAAAYQGHALPASAPWIEVPRLANKDFLFEAEVTALLP